MSSHYSFYIQLYPLLVLPQYKDTNSYQTRYPNPPATDSNISPRCKAHHSKTPTPTPTNTQTKTPTPTPTPSGTPGVTQLPCGDIPNNIFIGELSNKNEKIRTIEFVNSKDYGTENVYALAGNITDWSGVTDYERVILYDEKGVFFGDLTPTFDTGNSVYSIEYDYDNNFLYVGGDFESLRGVPGYNNLVRFYADNGGFTHDTSFSISSSLPYDSGKFINLIKLTQDGNGSIIISFKDNSNQLSRLYKLDIDGNIISGPTTPTLS